MNHQRGDVQAGAYAAYVMLAFLTVIVLIVLGFISWLIVA